MVFSPDILKLISTILLSTMMSSGLPCTRANVKTNPARKESNLQKLAPHFFCISPSICCLRVHVQVAILHQPRGRPGCLVERDGVRLPDLVLHVPALDHDRQADGEVGPGGECVLLLLLHRGPVLPRVLHTPSNRLRPWSWCCSHVVGQVHLSYPGGSQVTLKN